MMYSLPLLLLIYCNITEGVLEWTVIGKVTDYGQNVTLFCNVSNCCPNDAGWDRWTPHQRTLYIDVKTGRSNKKYDGKVLRDGYTLIIQNLTKDDLNVSYSCLYGVTLGEIKFLQKEDVFSFKSNRHTNFPIDSSEHTEGKITGTTIVVVFVAAIAVFFLIYLTTKYRIVKKSNKSEEDLTLMKPLIGKNKEQEGETNSHMPNEHNDTEGNHGSSTNTLVEGETNSHMPNEHNDTEGNHGSSTDTLVEAEIDSLQSSGSQSCVPIDNQTEVKDVINKNPVPSNSKLFQVWPTDTTNSLATYRKNTKTHLMKNVQTDRIYNPDPKKKCRVLCILNEKSKDKIIYSRGVYLDTEITCLQMMGKKLEWDLTIHRNKSSFDIITILEKETKREFTSVRAFFVIIVSSGDQSGIYGTTGDQSGIYGTTGDQSGIYGTTGRKIKNNEITTKFEQVSGLKDKPKIFILDGCHIKSNIRDQRKGPEDVLDHAKVQKQNRDTNICTKSSEKGFDINDHRRVPKYQLDDTKVHNQDRETISKETTEKGMDIQLQAEGFMSTGQEPKKATDGLKFLVNYCCFEHVPDRKLDFYLCIANTLGRCDEIVKGSLVIGALLSVICEAGHYMTFKNMMEQVKIIVTEAEGKPEPEIKITDCLTKDFYLLPTSS